MTLLDLAKQFDAADPADIETRVGIADQMNVLLGARREEFDHRFSLVLEARPGHPTPAEAALRSLMPTE